MREMPLCGSEYGHLQGYGVGLHPEYDLYGTGYGYVRLLLRVKPKYLNVKICQ